MPVFLGEASKDEIADLLIIVDDGADRRPDFPGRELPAPTNLAAETLMGCVERTKYPAQFLLSMMPLTNEVTCTPSAGEDAGM